MSGARGWPLVSLLCVACGPASTEVDLALRSSRPVTLATLELHVTVDEAAPSPVVMLVEPGGAPRLPGATLLEVPGNASTVTVLAVATALDGARRTAIDTVRVRRGASVPLALRLEFGAEAPDGGSVDGLPLGSGCAVAGDCASGFCVDGMCCDRACDDGACVACSVAGGAASDGVCGPRRTGTLCRAAGGECDQPETCDGASSACPDDGRAGATVTCRAAIGACDLDDLCDGTAVACPPDLNKCAPSEYCAGATCATKKGNGAACGADVQCTSGFCTDGICCNARCSAGACDRCDAPGFLGTCRILDTATVCRTATSLCDKDVSCDGTNGACPPAQLHPATTVCRAASDLCDDPEYCTGTSSACPALDRVKPPGAICRAAMSGCDLVEACSGTTKVCPNDGRAATNTVSFFPLSGTDGTATLAGVYDSTVIEPSCTDGGSYRYGLVSFETQTLPPGAVVDRAVLSMCLDGGVGAGWTGLYTATYAIPIMNPGNTGSYIASLPFGGGGDMGVDIPASVVKTTARTQFQLLPDGSGCNPGTFSRRYAGSGTTSVTYACTRNAQNTYAMGLTVTYCPP